MRSRSLILLVAATALLVLGCDEDGPVSELRPGGTGAPVATGAPTPEPDPGDSDDGGTAAPVVTPAPEPEQPEPEQPAPGPVETVAPNPLVPDSDDGSLLPILLGIGLLVVAAAVIGAVVSRRGKQSPPASPTAPSPQMVLLTNAQWIHDHLSLELLAAPPADALQRWATERRRLDDVAIGAQQQYASGGGDAWSSLGQTMAALANALDTDLRLRAQVPPDPALIQESTAVVTRQRAILNQLVATLWPGATPPPPQR